MDKNIERIKRRMIQESMMEWPAFESQPAPSPQNGENIRDAVYEICMDDESGRGYMDGERIYSAIVERYGWVSPEADAAFEQAKAQFKFE